nr:BTAD domain-containing putative transcriptional regulator [Actinokineospora enzanensis]
MQVLGPLRAWLDDVELALGPARQRAVFALLVARAGRVVPRVDLIDEVWPGPRPGSADGNLNTYVSGLRKVLGPARESLASAPGGYVLRLADDALDSSVFTRAVERAGNLLSAGDPDGALALLEQAARLWHGEAYADVPAPFALARRRHLAESRLIATELRVRAALALGRHAEPAAELADLIARHPARELLRELRMRAQLADGCPDDALETYRQARRALVEEHGVEPGPVLSELRQRALVASGAVRAPRPRRLRVAPSWAIDDAQRAERLDRYVGRQAEVGLLRDLVSDVVGGRGRSVWIEGEPGIGKSELLAVGLGDAARSGCQLAWTAAQESYRRHPLRTIMECLAVEPDSADPRRAAAAGPADAPGADPLAAPVDELLALVDDACTTGPLVLVIDDLQWADEASVLLWHRLAGATRQLPLLLVAATRPDQGRRDLVMLRRGLDRHGGRLIRLDPLTPPETTLLVGRLVGARPGPGLTEVTDHAAGNPLYVRELTESLLRRAAVRVRDGIAEVDPDRPDDAPRSLAAAVRRTLEFLTPRTRELLRSGALLGQEFGIDELAALTGDGPMDLADAVAEAIAGNVVVESGDRLAFRHPFLRQVLYDGIPDGLRPVLHRRAAELLDRREAPVAVVAEHVAGARPDAWVVDWLVGHHRTLATRAPLVAVDVLRTVLDGDETTAVQRSALHATLVRTLFRLNQLAPPEAGLALSLATDVAETRHLLASVRQASGDTAGAITVAQAALDDPSTPEIWRTRHRWLMANFHRTSLDDLDVAKRTAVAVHTEAIRSGDAYTIAHSKQTLWLISTGLRDHPAALSHVDGAVAALDAHAELAGKRIDMMDNRIFTLQNLDRLVEAETTLRQARELAARHNLPAGMHVTAAVHHYWTGRWDEALVELDGVTEDGPAITFYGLREPGAAALLSHGVAALLAVHRGDPAEAAAHLDAAECYAPSNMSERESCDFHLVAAAMAEERRGALGAALCLLDPILRPEYARIMLRHQWLPYLTRLALDAGDRARARLALTVCEAEAAAEVLPARAFAAAEHCRALVTGDPTGALNAAKHYRAVGRPLESATAAENAAVLLAARGRLDAATSSATAARTVYRSLSASWDLARTRLRMPWLATGDAAETPGTTLSALEEKIAGMVADGLSNPDIAAALGLPRRTVQSHVTRLLDKLHTRSRHLRPTPHSSHADSHPA